MAPLTSELEKYYQYEKIEHIRSDLSYQMAEEIYNDNPKGLLDRVEIGDNIFYPHAHTFFNTYSGIFLLSLFRVENGKKEEFAGVTGIRFPQDDDRVMCISSKELALGGIDQAMKVAFRVDKQFVLIDDSPYILTGYFSEEGTLGNAILQGTSQEWDKLTETLKQSESL